MSAVRASVSVGHLCRGVHSLSLRGRATGSRTHLLPPLAAVVSNTSDDLSNHCTIVKATPFSHVCMSYTTVERTGKTALKVPTISLEGTHISTKSVGPPVSLNGATIGNFPRQGLGFPLGCFPADARRQTISSTFLGLEYICPPVETGTDPTPAILDFINAPSGGYECPLLPHQHAEISVPTTIRGELGISDPTPLGKKPVIKEAKKIMKIRHRKIKKHQLRKRRKRLFYDLRKRAVFKKRIKEKKLQAICDGHTQQAEQFDAEVFVQEQLALARKAGYKINPLEKR